MRDFLQPNELNKTLDRFNKIRLYTHYGYMNILPISQLKKKPFKYNQIQLNTDFHFNAIIMDIDDESLLTEWSSVGLPVPTIQTLNRNNDKAHLVWLLNVPISKNNKKAVAYYKDIVNSIKILIGADDAYQNHQTKNFLNRSSFRVTYNDAAYDLEDFKDFIIQAPKKIYSHKDESSGSRHIDLFNQLRRYGYKYAKSRNLLELLEKKAALINEQLDSPINPKSIIKSVYKFCEEHANNFRNKETSPVMKFKKIKNLTPEEFSVELHRRRKLSALRTAEIKRIKTSSKIKVAIDKLIRSGEALTYRNIALLSKISLRTAKNYFKIIKLFKKKINGAISSIRVIVVGAKQTTTTQLYRSYLKDYYLMRVVNYKKMSQSP